MMPCRRPNGAAGLLLLCLVFCGMNVAKAAITELFVSDGQSGIALYGFDPVAFFIGREPQRGSAAFELQYQGAVFRFANEGNRAAFQAHPDVYLPRYGGYDPVAIGRGSPTPGLPGLFVVREKQLFLFSNEKSRAIFLSSPKEALAAAEFSWPQVRRGLVQH